MSTKLDAALSEVESLLAAAATAVKKGKTVKADNSGHCTDCGAPYYSRSEQRGGKCLECAGDDDTSDHDMSGHCMKCGAPYYSADEQSDGDCLECAEMVSAAAVSAKKKPQHAVEKDSKGKWRIRSMKDGKLWPQTYDSKQMANKGLAAYHLRKKGVPPKKTKAAADCPECGTEAKIDMRGKHCPECGYSDAKEMVEAAADCPECGEGHDGSEKCSSCGCDTKASAKTVKAADEKMGYDPRDKMMLRKLKRMVDRGYLSPEEVAGAVMEALHAAKVSTRMAGAIAQKVKESLVDAEEDVVDVSAKAKLNATRRK